MNHVLNFSLHHEALRGWKPKPAIVFRSGAYGRWLGLDKVFGWSPQVALQENGERPEDTYTGVVSVSCHVTWTRREGGRQVSFNKLLWTKCLPPRGQVLGTQWESWPPGVWERCLWWMNGSWQREECEEAGLEGKAIKTVKIWEFRILFIPWGQKWNLVFLWKLLQHETETRPPTARQWNRHWLQRRQALGSDQHSGCVTWGRLNNLSGSQWLHLQNGDSHIRL